MFYLHPWEIDPDQPRVAGVGQLATARHRLNLRSTARKLQALLTEFPFGTISDALAASPRWQQAAAASDFGQDPVHVFRRNRFGQFLVVEAQDLRRTLARLVVTDDLDVGRERCDQPGPPQAVLASRFGGDSGPGHFASLRRN
jgi:hypothetical protein